MEGRSIGEKLESLRQEGRAEKLEAGRDGRQDKPNPESRKPEIGLLTCPQNLK